MSPSRVSRHSIACLLLLLLGGAPDAGAQGAASYSRDADAVVIRYREILPIRGPERGPTLTVYGDGRVLAHFPAFMQRRGDYQAHLAPPELDALVHRIAYTYDVVGLDPKQAQEAARRAHEAATSATRTETAVLDADTIQIELRCCGVEKSVSWTGLRSDAQRHPSIAAIQRLKGAQGELRALLRSEQLQPVPR